MMKNPFFVVRVIAALMLLIAFAELPYAYYQMLRWVVCGVTGYGAFISYEKQNILWAWTFGITAILFNPIMPFYMQREMWQILDLTAAVVLIISLFTLKDKKFGA